MKIIPIVLTVLISLGNISVLSADENRYQAHWNGKSYLIVDSDDGHMWTLRNDSMIYNGQLDGADFIPPATPQVWQQKHGKWAKSN